MVPGVEGRIYFMTLLSPLIQYDGIGYTDFQTEIIIIGHVPDIYVLLVLDRIMLK